MTNESGDHLKKDHGKDPWHLLPFDALRGAVKVLAFGAAKYRERGWEEGMDWSRVYSATQRHLAAWWMGEGVDPDTGYSHLWHALCCLMFLTAYEIRNVGNDDRPKRMEPVEEYLEEVESSSEEGLQLYLWKYDYEPDTLQPSRSLKDTRFTLVNSIPQRCVHGC